MLKNERISVLVPSNRTALLKDLKDAFEKEGRGRNIIFKDSTDEQCCVEVDGDSSREPTWRAVKRIVLRVERQYNKTGLKPVFINSSLTTPERIK